MTPQQMPDGTLRQVSPSRRRCCSWVMVGLGGVLLLVGVVLFAYGLSPSGRAMWGGMKWLGVPCAVVGVTLLIGSIVLYITATGTKDSKHYPVERVRSKRLQGRKRDENRQSVIRDPSL